MNIYMRIYGCRHFCGLTDALVGLLSTTYLPLPFTQLDNIPKNFETRGVVEDETIYHIVKGDTYV